MASGHEASKRPSGPVTVVGDSPSVSHPQLVSSLTGAAATDADLNTVLANTTALWIRGEFNTGPDAGFLDHGRWGASN